MPTVLKRNRKKADPPTVIANKWGADGKEFYYIVESASGQGKANPVFSLATQAILALSGYLALVPYEKCSRFGHDKSLFSQDIWIMASSFFAFLSTSTSSRSLKTQKNGQYSTILTSSKLTRFYVIVLKHLKKRNITLVKGALRIASLQTVTFEKTLQL